MIVVGTDTLLGIQRGMAERGEISWHDYGRSLRRAKNIPTHKRKDIVVN